MPKDKSWINMCKCPHRNEQTGEGITSVNGSGSAHLQREATLYIMNRDD